MTGENALAFHKKGGMQQKRFIGLVSVGVAQRLMVHINFPLDIMKETEKDGLVPKRGGREGMERRKTVLRE